MYGAKIKEAESTYDEPAEGQLRSNVKNIIASRSYDY